jgi:hypothetical protein
MGRRAGRKSRAAAKVFCLLMFAGAGLTLSQSVRAANYNVSAACGRNYEPNVIQIDGYVNTPVALTVPQIEALPGQEMLNVTYLNHLGEVETYSETGPTLWTALSIAAGGIKVPPPTPDEYVGEPAAQTTLYIVVIGTDGYETVVSEGEIDPGFGNAPILLGSASPAWFWLTQPVVRTQQPLLHRAPLIPRGPFRR